MWIRRSAIALLVSSVLVGCSDRTPTTAAPGDLASVSAKAGGKQAAKRASLLTNLSISQGSFSGTLSITRIGFDETTGSLVFSGTVTSAAGVTDTFTDVAGTLGDSGGASAAARGNNERGTCDILFLDLGPIFLDLLGLQLDLSPIQLDLDAAPGPGNLLGNLLCALTGLLDGGGLLTQIIGLLDRINAILDRVNSL